MHKISSLLLAIVVLFAGPTHSAFARPGTSALSAADLRTALNNLLVEHIYLDTMASIAVIRADDATFQAASATVNQNNTELGEVIRVAYGDDGRDQFLNVWNRHVAQLLDYARGAAAHDQKRKDAALAALDAGRQEVDDLLTSINPNLQKGAVAHLLIPHVTTLTESMDAMADGDWKTAFARVQDAVSHMQMLADALSSAIARQMPDKFRDAGAIDSGWGNLRAGLNTALLAHTYLVFYSFDASVHGPDAAFQAAVDTRGANTRQLGQVIGSIYSPEAEKDFRTLWRSHITMLADYAEATVNHDAAGQQKALAELDQYRADLDTLITTANPQIPKGSVASGLKDHVDGLVRSLDAMLAGDQATALNTMHEDGHHMQMIADPLALAIGLQFPEKFGSGSPGAVPVTGGERANAGGGHGCCTKRGDDRTGGLGAWSCGGIR